MTTGTWLALLAAPAVIALAVVIVGRGEDDNNIIFAQEDENTTMKHIADELPGYEAGGDGHIGMSDSEMGMDMDPAMLEDGEHRNLRAMAQDIISAQTREITQLKRWRKTWYGSARVPTEMHGSLDAAQMAG